MWTWESAFWLYVLHNQVKYKCQERLVVFFFNICAKKDFFPMEGHSQTCSFFFKKGLLMEVWV